MMFLFNIVHEVTGGTSELLMKNSRLRKAIATLASENPTVRYGCDERASLPSRSLLDHLRDEHGRRISIEDKAKTNVIGITLAIGVMFAGAALLSAWVIADQCNTEWLNPVMPPFVAGVFFLLTGGWVALDVIRVDQVFVWTVEDEAEYRDDEIKKPMILWCIELNRRINYIKANGTDASYRCIRNGTIMLVVAAMIFSYQVFS